MNHSIQSADRATHLKVVIVALIVGHRTDSFRHFRFVRPPTSSRLFI